MKILFVYSLDDIFLPGRPLRSQDAIPFGVSYISSVLKDHGHSTKAVVLSRMLGKRNLEKISASIDDFRPGLVCFSAVYSEYGFIAGMARYIKNRNPEIFLMAGGVHVSLNPQEVISDSLDALCIGEGEYPTLELVSHLEKGKRLSGIANLWIKRGSGIERNPPRPFLQDLDSLPFPDREMWQEWIGEQDDPVNPVLLGRGCPFYCTYCCNHALKKLAEGQYIRVRSPDNIISEIKELLARFPKKTNFNLEVESLGVDKGWAIELCSKLENLNAAQALPLSYIANLRITPHLELEQLFESFKKSNFTTVKIGLESGSERVRSQVLKRNYSNQDIVNCVGLAREHGLKVLFYNLIGIPGETKEDFLETIRINRRCLPDKTIPHVFFPYPGTELYAQCKSGGLLPKTIDTTLERCRATLDLPGFSKKQIQNAFIWFEFKVYRGHKPGGVLFIRALLSMLLSNTYLHKIYRKLTYLEFFGRLRKLANRSLQQVRL